MPARPRTLSAVALASVTLVGLAAAWPLAGPTHVGSGPGAGADPLALAVWLALWAPAAGVACARWRAPGKIGLGLALSLPPIVWGVALAAVDACASRGIPSPFLAALTVGGLFLVGGAWGLGLRSRAGLPSVSAIFLATVAVAWFPTRAGLPGRPWPENVASRALGLSPVTLVAECAGVDWMRRAAVYDAAGTDRFQRVPYVGKRAAPWSFALGLACVLCALAWTHRAHAQERETRQRA